MAAVTRKAVESPCPSGPDRVEAAFPSPQGSLTLQTCCGPLPCGEEWVPPARVDWASQVGWAACAWCPLPCQLGRWEPLLYPTRCEHGGA